MAPDKFYPQYLPVKLYDKTGQQQNAVEVATLLLKKEIKIESTAISEIHCEMKKIIERNVDGYTLYKENTTNGQKGWNNQNLLLKYTLVTQTSTFFRIKISNKIGLKRKWGDALGI